MREATILRKHSIVVQEPFNGTFEVDCITKPVPELSCTFINASLTVLKYSVAGSSDDSDMNQITQVTLRICQIVTYNMVNQTPLDRNAIYFI